MLEIQSHVPWLHNNGAPVHPGTPVKMREDSLHTQKWWHCDDIQKRRGEQRRGKGKVKTPSVKDYSVSESLQIHSIDVRLYWISPLKAIT